MTDLILVGEGAQLPAHLQQYAQEAESASSLITSFNSIPSLSIRGKRFRFMQNGVEVVYPSGQNIEVVILGSDPLNGTAKSFYSKAFTKDAEDIPDCFSADGIKPDPFVANPVSPGCAACPNNVFGSAVRDGVATKGKACGDHKNLIVVEASNLEAPLMMLRVPATSLRGLSEYGRHLNNGKVAPFLLVTEVSFADEDHPQLVFNASRFLDATDAPVAVARSKSKELTAACPTSNIGIAIDVESKEENDLPSPPAAPTAPIEPEYRMTALAVGLTKEAYIAAGWTVKLLIENKYMEIV